MTFPDAYLAAILKLKMVLPDDSHVRLEDILRDVYVAGLYAAYSSILGKEDSGECRYRIAALIEQVQGDRKNG
jgi:hypothetical protein